MKARILVVEDDPIARENLLLLLQQEGFDSVGAVNGRDGLKRLAEGPVDLVLCDIMMPVMDGVEMLEGMQRRGIYRNIPFVFLTARAEKEDIRRSKALGVDDYITKPFEIEDVIPVIVGKLKRIEELRQGVRDDLLREREQLVTVLGHELRTPLSAIWGGTQLLEEALDRDSVSSECLSLIWAGNRRLLRLIEKVEHLHESEGAGFAPDEPPAHLLAFHPILEDICKDLEEVSFSLDVDTGDEFLPLPERYLSMLLREIIENAAKLSPPGGSVVISGRRQAGKYVLQVTDSGGGFPEGDRERLFEPFYQHDRERKEQQGLGVGLAIVRNIAAAFGIIVTLTNDAAGHGCVRLDFNL